MGEQQQRLVPVHAAMLRTLVVGNDPTHAAAIGRCLRRGGFAVCTVHTHEAALSLIDRARPDLVIVDLRPGTTGIELCRRMRARTRVPVIVLAPNAPGVDELLDCEASVDDYMTKPVRPKELIAHVRAVLRPGPFPPRVGCRNLSFGDLRIDPRTRSIDLGKRPTKLTPKEFELLYFLATHPGQIFSREQLLYNIWESGFMGDPNTITIHIRRVRLKMEPDPANPRHLKTVWGAGYTFEP